MTLHPSGFGEHDFRSAGVLELAGVELAGVLGLARVLELARVLGPAGVLGLARVRQVPVPAPPPSTRARQRCGGLAQPVPSEAKGRPWSATAA